MYSVCTVMWGNSIIISNSLFLPVDFWASNMTVYKLWLLISELRFLSTKSTILKYKVLSLCYEGVSVRTDLQVECLCVIFFSVLLSPTQHNSLILILGTWYSQSRSQSVEFHTEQLEQLSVIAKEFLSL